MQKNEIDFLKILKCTSTLNFQSRNRQYPSKQLRRIQAVEIEISSIPTITYPVESRNKRESIDNRNTRISL